MTNDSKAPDGAWCADDQRDPTQRLMATTGITLPGKPSALSLAIVAGPSSPRFKDGDWLEPVAVWLTREQAVGLRDFLNAEFPRLSLVGGGDQ